MWIFSLVFAKIADWTIKKKLLTTTHVRKIANTTCKIKTIKLGFLFSTKLMYLFRYYSSWFTSYLFNNRFLHRMRLYHDNGSVNNGRRLPRYFLLFSHHWPWFDLFEKRTLLKKQWATFRSLCFSILSRFKILLKHFISWWHLLAPLALLIDLTDWCINLTVHHFDWFLELSWKTNVCFLLNFAWFIASVVAKSIADKFRIILK